MPLATTGRLVHSVKSPLTPLITLNGKLNLMSRLAVISLDPYLGHYSVVWDSVSAKDPRTPGADFHDAVISLTRPEVPPAWPKESSPSPSVAPCLSANFSLTSPRTPSTSEPVVLRVRDTQLGLYRAASRIERTTSSTRGSPSPPPASPSSSGSPRPGPRSSRSSSSASNSSSASGSSARSYVTASSSSRMSSSSSASTKRAPRSFFFRFDWDASFPRLGFRHEGMDVSAPGGHVLAFSPPDQADDAGRPFLVLELRPADPAADGEPVVVVAKKQVDEYTQAVLSDAERERVGMVAEDDGVGRCATP
ncbi:uncharacterized protein BXZ73DRAFT_97781 [Epithele typhae]|uniref:uncharacterized protein n=1 Tax=Epithele typhae TaxID=378194 RepID=UPI002007F917|nr:uncharacterized protein BXZ73DRAFT_97781 [Epithele typhae]KAH9942366.1 hypothetical protein BXZ73DRAFT_97781 [Epithele typhae]